MTDRSFVTLSYNVLTGGLMRCCLGTLEEHMNGVTVPPKEGETLSCKYHEDDPDNEEMIFTDGAWRWNREKGEA